MNNLKIIITVIFGILFLGFLLNWGAKAALARCDPPECNEDWECGEGGRCTGGNCCVGPPDPCDGTTCGSCSGACGGGTGSVQCHDACSNWFESCTNNTPCVTCGTCFGPCGGNLGTQNCWDTAGGFWTQSCSTPACPPPPTKYCKNCAPNSPNLDCCTSVFGVDPCSADPRTCTETQPVQCTTANNCPDNSVQQQCAGKACSVGKQCVNGECQYYCIGTPPCGGGTPPPGGIATCSVNLTPATFSVTAGDTVNYTATVTSVTGGSVTSVAFSSTNTSAATVSPASDTTSPYNTTATGVSVGNTTISAGVFVNGVSTCSNTASLSVTAPVAWWQVKDADVITNGSLSSQIPATCSLPQCNSAFGLNGDGGYPGVPSYTGSYDFNAGTGLGTPSSKGWVASSQTNYKKIYDYSFFKGQIPPDVQTNIYEINSNSVVGGYFNSSQVGQRLGRGFWWYHFNGETGAMAGQDLTINNVNLPADRKVILLVEGADLYLTGKINLNKGRGFFMAIVGKRANGTKGNIRVSPFASSPNQPDIEGIYYADRTFHTGVDNRQFWIRGSVAAYDGVVLERNLSDNSRTPAEYFEYAPELLTLYPNIFTNRKIRWKEVAP